MELLENYKGYKIPSKIKIVRSNWKYENMDQGFIVDPDTKGQLETALNWAAGYNDEKREEVKKNIIETDNEGFEVEFLKPAGGSSQGGKLSFWDCKITKDDISYIVGINQDLLLELIKSATIIKGKVQEKCLFVKQRGNTGIIIKDSEIYRACMKEIETKNKLQNLKKTTNWEKGYYYNTPTGLSDIYIGDAYLWFTEDKTSAWSKKIIHKIDKPIKIKIMISSWYADRNKLLSEIIKDKTYFFEYIGEEGKKTLPARFKVEEGKIDIDLTSEQLEELKLKYLKEQTKDIRNIYSRLLRSYLTTFTPKYPELPDELKNQIEFEVW